MNDNATDAFDAATVASTAATDTSSFVDVMQIDRDALAVSVLPSRSVIGLDSGESTIQICATIVAKKLPEDDSQRAPVDIIVALDNSASMRGEKLALCKTSLELLLRQLLPEDRFGLVSFSTEAVVELPVQKVSATHRMNALIKIQSLQVQANTNISAGIGLASQEMRTISNPNAVQTIFLLTDGHANVGITHHDALVEVAKKCLVGGTAYDGDDRSTTSSLSGTSWVAPSRMSTKAAGDSGNFKTVGMAIEPEGSQITMHTFGYGSDHDSNMLRDISQATSGGTYYFVENDSNVLTAFGDALGGILSVVAQNAVLHIDVPPESMATGVELVNVHHKNKIAREDGSVTVSIGDFYAEESRDVLFEVTLAKPVGVISHAIVTLSYTDTLFKSPTVAGPMHCTIERVLGDEISPRNKHVEAQWLRVLSTEAMMTADTIASRGKLDEAKATIVSMLQKIQESSESVKSNPLVTQLSEDLNRCKAGLATRGTYQNHGHHYMQTTFASHGTQRCMDSVPTNCSVYRGSKKVAMRRNFQMP